MFHHDQSNSMINNNQRNKEVKYDRHPVDRILNNYYKSRPLSTNNRSNFYQIETNHIIQRQRIIRSFLHQSNENEPSIRKPITLTATPKSLSINSISPPLLFTQLNQSFTNNNNRQQTIVHPSPIINCHTKIEHSSSFHPILDISNYHLPSQHSSGIPSNFIFRPLSSPRMPVSQRSLKINSQIKTIDENSSKLTAIPSKSSSIFTRRLSEQDTIHNRALTSALFAKSRLIKQSKNQQHTSTFNRLNQSNKINDIEQFYIKKPTIKNIHYENTIKNKEHHNKLISNDSKNSDYIANENQSIRTDENSSISTCHSQQTPSKSVQSSLSSESDPFSCSSCSFDFPPLLHPNNSSKKYINSRQKLYNNSLPPVAEYFNDEDTESFNDINIELKKKIVEKKPIQLNKKNKRVHEMINDQTSLTFDILNQEETNFEKQLFKSRRFH